jgi:hypothetical protein
MQAVIAMQPQKNLTFIVHAVVYFFKRIDNSVCSPQTRFGIKGPRI